MSHRFNIEKLLTSRQNPLPLYASAFFFSGAHGGIFTLALPFIILLIGGTDKDIGLCFGLGTIAYLISCLMAAKYLDRFSPKCALQLSSAFITIAVIAVFFIIRLSVRDRFPIDPIMAITVINIFLCLALALFWPPMMGWLSLGHEGPPLSRRLGLFNLSWSFALAISPLIAGFIIQINPNLAVLAAALLLAIAFICVSAAPSPAATPKSIKRTEIHRPDPAEKLHPDNAAFCSMARLALITTCITIALMRTQFALLFTENLGFTKSQFGILTTLWCFSNFAVFYITGKTHRWHHKLTPFIFAQVMTALGMILILFSGSLWVLCAAVIFIGAGQSFVYSSHQYYGVSGRKNRSGPMAVHEILISIGYGSGAIVGGYLAEYLNRYAPYRFGLGAVLIALGIQICIILAHKKYRCAHS